MRPLKPAMAAHATNWLHNVACGTGNKQRPENSPHVSTSGGRHPGVPDMFDVAGGWPCVSFPAPGRSAALG